MKKALKVSFSLLIALTAANMVLAQPKTKKEHKKEDSGFEKLPSGLQIKIVKHGDGKVKPTIGDYIEMHIHLHIGDSILFDSRKMNKNEPVPLQVQMKHFNGDPMEGFEKLVVGDSAVMLVPLDSMKKAGARLYPRMKDGDLLEYDVVMVSVKTAVQKKKEDEEKAAQQKVTDDKILQEYFAKNKITPKKTVSGLYYTVQKEGTGEMPKAGQSVTVNYTGKTLDGKTFDSNVDSNFHHVKPFTFTLDRGQVIKGWDEGVGMMKKGEEATLYIPSGMAYGQRSPSPAIPENGILMFNVEVTDIQSATPPQQGAPAAKMKH